MHDIYTLICKSILNNKAKDREINYFDILSLGDERGVDKVKSIHEP